MYERLDLEEYQKKKSGVGDIHESTISQAKKQVLCTV